MTRRKQHTITANYTVPAYERDVTIVANAVDLVVTLPPAGRGTKGNRVTLVVEDISASTGASLSPAPADMIRGTGVTGVDNKDLINTAATDALGDAATLVCDGDTGWWIENLIGTWALEA